MPDVQQTSPDSSFRSKEGMISRSIVVPAWGMWCREVGTGGLCRKMRDREHELPLTGPLIEKERTHYKGWWCPT